VGVVGVLLVAAGKGPVSITILVAPTNLDCEESVTGVAGENSCRTHGGYISVEKLRCSQHAATILATTSALAI
jgi:hypothetical protein